MRQKPKTGPADPLAAVSGLSREVRAIYDQILAEYRVTDAGGLQTLLSGAVCLDRALACEKQIRAEGLTAADRFGQGKPHPLLPAARDARAAWQSALRALNLEIGTPPETGRPKGL